MLPHHTVTLQNKKKVFLHTHVSWLACHFETSMYKEVLVPDPVPSIGFKLKLGQLFTMLPLDGTREALVSVYIVV